MSVVEILAIIDKSGSMGGLEKEVVGSLNGFIEAQQALPGHANLTVVMYDDRYEVPLESVPLKDVKPFTQDQYVPRGMTATYDAVGKALSQLEERNPEKAIIMINTDGGENASHEYTQSGVAAKVKAAEDRGWEVVFLAQNIDARAASTALGMTRGFSKGMAAGAEGIHEGYATMNLCASSYRSA
jgi:uncharacterized protein YegL